MIYVGHHFYAVQIQDRWPLNAFEYERVAVQPSVDESKFTGYSIGCWDNDIVNIQFGSIAYTRIVCRGSSVYWELVFQGICIRIITEYIPKFEIVYTRFYCRIKWIEKFREIIVINHGRRWYSGVSGQCSHTIYSVLQIWYFSSIFMYYCD